MSQSRFAFLKDTQTENAAEPVEPAHPASVPEPAPAAPVAPRGPGRPPNGKRSNPEYAQVSAYIPRTVHSAVQIALIQEGKKQDVSDLIGELLDNWLKSRNAE